jgi:hypothetical protein
MSGQNGKSVQRVITTRIATNSYTRDLYLTIHNTRKRQISVPPVGWEPIIPASERPQTQALDRAATGIGITPSDAYKLVVKIKYSY